MTATPPNSPAHHTRPPSLSEVYANASRLSRRRYLVDVILTCCGGCRFNIDVCMYGHFVLGCTLVVRGFWRLQRNRLVMKIFDFDPVIEFWKGE
jgi:hypothetical protein